MEYTCELKFLSRFSILTRDIDIAIPSVGLSVRPLRSGIQWKRLNILSRYPNHFSFISIKHLREIPTGSPPAGALNTGGV